MTKDFIVGLDGCPEITVVRLGSVSLLRASGGLDGADVAGWNRSLVDVIGALPAGVTGVIVDLTQVTRVSTVATRSLTAAALAVPEGVQLVVVAQNLVRQVLKIVDHTGTLTVVAELGEALANLADVD